MIDNEIRYSFGGKDLTRVEALDTARDLLMDYLGGSPDADKQFIEAYNVLTRMRNSMQKQSFKNKMKNNIKAT